jgi:tetratricopeptide (TPR) repeat protein
MKKSRLSENCHAATHERLNFASMNIKPLIPAFFLLLAASCNNEDGKTAAAPVAGTEQAMKDSVARFPDSLLLQENLIEYYRQNGEYEKAIVATSEALQKDRLNARLWDIKATLHFENEDTLQAITAFENAVRILPAPQYLMSLGSLYAQTKNTKALQVADALARPEMGNTAKEAVFIKGLYYGYAGDKAKAIAFFDQCLALDYNFMFAYREKAIALYDLGKYEDALKALDRAITLQNNFDEGYYWRGRCFEKLNKKAEAIEEYRTALLYAKDFIEAKEALARLGEN